MTIHRSSRGPESTYIDYARHTHYYYYIINIIKNSPLDTLLPDPRALGFSAHLR
jgi:hypothetical protein